VIRKVFEELLELIKEADVIMVAFWKDMNQTMKKTMQKTSLRRIVRIHRLITIMSR
jgi:hypothetical protein